MSTETNTIVASDSASRLPAIPPPADGVAPAPPKLTPEQEIAIAGITARKRTADILTEARCSRTTLWRWRTFDANFIAALNQWRHDVQIQVRDRISNIIEEAADAVHGSVRARDGRLGLSVLHKSGNLKTGPTDPIDPYSIFGAGIDDQNGRRPAFDGFVKIRNTLTAEQANRLLQIFANGVVIDNERLGRPTADIVRDMAKLPEPPLISEVAMSVNKARGLSDDGLHDGNASRNESPPQEAPRVKSPTAVKARAVNYSARAGTFFRR